MRTRFLTAFLLVVFLVGGCSLFAWKEFKSTKGQFSLQVPGTPKEQKETVKTQAGDIDLHLFLLEQKEIAYMVGYSDYPEPLIKQAEPEAILDGARNGAVSNVNGKLLSERAVSLEGHKGREIKVKTEKGVIKARIFLVEARLYQLMTVTAKEKTFAENTKRFFDSFKLLKK